MLFCHSGAVQVGWWVGDVSGLVGIEWIFLGGVRYTDSVLLSTLMVLII